MYSSVASLLDSSLNFFLENGSGSGASTGEENSASAMLVDATSFVNESNLNDLLLPLAANSAGQDELLVEENLLKMRREITQHLQTFSRAHAEGNEVAAQSAMRSIEFLKQNIKSLREYQEILGISSPQTRETRPASSFTGGLALSRKDLPKFQLASSLVRPFPSEEVFESAEHFLKTFEKVVASSGRDIQLVWKTLFPLCLPISEDAWYETNMKLARSWYEARKVFKDSHSSKTAVRQYTDLVFTMVMKSGEPLADYSKRFLQAVCNTDIPKDNERIADRFLASLLSPVQSVIKLAMFNSNSSSWTVEQMTQAGRDVLENDASTYVASSNYILGGHRSTHQDRKGSSVERHKRHHRDNKKGKPKEGKVNKKHFCTQHGKNGTQKTVLLSTSVPPRNRRVVQLA